MKKKMLGAIITLLLLISWAGAANALTMEFNTASTGYITSYTEGDATITDMTPDYANMFITTSYGIDYPPGLHTHGGTSTWIRFAMNDGSLFDFTSIEIVQNSSPLYDIVGSNGASVDVPSGVIDYVMNFSQFSAVSYIDIIGNTGLCLTLDNLVYNAADPVPEPATMLLLGSGLIGLAGARRKLKK